MDDVLDFLGVVLTESDASVGAVRDAIQDEYGEAGLVHFDALVAQSDLRADDILTSEMVKELMDDHDEDDSTSDHTAAIVCGLLGVFIVGAAVAVAISYRSARDAAPSAYPDDVSIHYGGDALGRAYSSVDSVAGSTVLYRANPLVAGDVP